MNAALLLCALNRAGAPTNSGDLLDQANALAMDAGWPPRSWKGCNVQRVAALMKGCESRGECWRVTDTKPPVWCLMAYNRTAEIPAAPDPEGEDHPLHGMTSRQKFVLFDVLDATVAKYASQNQEAHAMLIRHTRELADHAARAKRELLAAGLELSA